MTSLLLLAVALGVGPAHPNTQPPIDSSGKAQKDIDLDDNALVNPLVIYQEAPASDLDPDDVLVHAGHGWGQGTQTAANLVLAGGSDEKYFTSTDYANSTGDTLTIMVGNCAAGVCAVAGAVTFTESTDWDCDVTSDIVCACALYDALISTPVTGVTAERADGTCSDAKVYLQPAGSTYSVHLTVADTGGGGVWGTATNGTDGRVFVPAGTNFNSPGLALMEEDVTPNDSGLLYQSNSVYIVHNDDGVVRVQKGGVVTLSEPLTVPAADHINFSGRTKWTSSGDGIWEMGINAGTRGVRFDTATTADWLSLKDESGNDLTLAVGALVLSSGGTRSIYTSIVGANLQIGTSSGPSPFSTGAYTTYTGNQTHAGDYDSGTLTYCSTGTTNTDGDTGDCISQTGASGDGTGADAGDHIWNINGANEAMRIAGATGSATFAYESYFANNAAAATFGAVGTDADVVLAFDAVTNQGSLTYREDEDRFHFGSSDISLAVNDYIGWSGYFLLEADSAADQVIFKVDSGVGNQIVITPGDESDDHGHAAAGGGNAVLYIHGDDIDDDATAWISATHDLTDGVVETGKGDFKLISAGGDLYIGTIAQGAKLDMTTTDDVLNLGTEVAATIGLRNVAGWWDLQADGDLILDNPGATVNSPTLLLRGDDGGVEEDASLHLVQGADPYLRISVDDDNTTPGHISVLDIHDTIIANSTAGLTSFGDTANHDNYFAEVYTQELVLTDSTVISNHLTITWDDNDTGDRTFGLLMSGGNRALTMEASATVSQDYSTDSATVQFGTLTVGNTGLVVGTSTPFSDAAGTLTLQNVDALDATTETTIEGAIDTVADLTITTRFTVTAGTDLPATCVQGEIFMDTNDDSCADDNAGTGTFCGCAATNVWEAFQ